MILCIRYCVHFVHLTDVCVCVCVCVCLNKSSAKTALIIFPYFKKKTNHLSQRSMNSYTFFFFLVCFSCQPSSKQFIPINYQDEWGSFFLL